MPQFWEPQDTDSGETRLFARIGRTALLVVAFLVLGFVLGPLLFN